MIKKFSFQSILLGAHLVWLGMLCLLGAWWGRLLLRQASRIVDLEEQLGWSRDLSQIQWHRTQSMLYWESCTFFGLLIGCTALIFWLYWRDVHRNRGIQAFFASFTHELKTPLTSIRLQAESIAESLSNHLQTPVSLPASLIERLLEDTSRLECQVERTLELARLEGGGLVTIQTFQIKRWLEHFLRVFREDDLSKIELQVQLEDCWLAADPIALQVIFRNLFENALKHSQRSPVQVVITSQIQADSLKLTLRDQGQGYTGKAEQLGSLFQRGPTSQGTGVGLYLVKTLMKKMKGRVTFVSSNSGFEVNLFFPIAKRSTLL